MILAVAHDAGGAEVLSSHIRRTGMKCRFSLGGPAVEIFRRKLGVEQLISVEAGVAQAESVLTATSWQSDLEVDALVAAKRIGLPTASVLDHWMGYSERFVRRGRCVMPDEILVVDEHAAALAASVFPGHPVRQIPNAYQQDLINEFSNRADRIVAGRVLWVSEPIADYCRTTFGDPRWLNYDEMEALEYFLRHVREVWPSVMEVRVRPHPAEQPQKFREIVQAQSDLVCLASDKSLADEIARAELVAGCETMALVVALWAGRQVMSAIPPGGRTCQLPWPEIRHLRTLCP